MKKLLAVLLALALCLGLGLGVAEEAAAPYQLGDQMEDFTVTTYDGQTITLSAILQEKKMVLLNLWASWCSPCEREFPYLEEAYRKYQDQVAVVAVSVEKKDTDEVLKAYAESHGLTFAIAGDTADLAKRFRVNSVPTSVVIDRFGTICLIEAGAQSSTDAFTVLFDVFCGDTYMQSSVLHEFPRKPANVPAADVAVLNDTLNAEGGTLSFTNPANPSVWPMILAEKDGRACLMSSNVHQDNTAATVYTDVEAKAGDALVVTFKLSSEAACDLFSIAVNEETVKVFGGAKDWMTYAYAFPTDGTYHVALSYVKDAGEAAGEDALWLEQVALVSGDAAQAALAANPTYPVAEATALSLLNEDAKKLTFDDPTFAMTSAFGLADYYLVPSGTAQFLAQLDDSVEPERALFYGDDMGYRSMDLGEKTTEGYTFSVKVDSVATTGYSYTRVMLLPSQEAAEMEMKTVILVASEADANALIATLQRNGYDVKGWSYADATQPSTNALPGEGVEAYYTLRFVDQNGEPVPGVLANVCDANTCAPMQADANGVLEFSNVPYAYDIHVLKVPDGYVRDAAQSWQTAPEGGELVIILTKE